MSGKDQTGRKPMFWISFTRPACDAWVNDQVRAHMVDRRVECKAGCATLVDFPLQSGPLTMVANATEFVDESNRAVAAPVR
jgi:hypothetical protein